MYYITILQNLNKHTVYNNSIITCRSFLLLFSMRFGDLKIYANKTNPSCNSRMVILPWLTNGYYIVFILFTTL